MFVSVDALFGCVRKCSAGTSSKECREELFINQEKVDSFLSTYRKTPTEKSMVSNHFLIYVIITKMSLIIYGYLIHIIIMIRKKPIKCSQQLSGQSIRLANGRSWVRIPSGTWLFFSYFVLLPHNHSYISYMFVNLYNMLQ